MREIKNLQNKNQTSKLIIHIFISNLLTILKKQQHSLLVCLKSDKAKLIFFQ